MPNNNNQVGCSACSSDASDKELLLEVSTISRDLDELETWIVRITESIVQSWTDRFPPLTIDVTGIDPSLSQKEKPYTTAAIYFTRLREALSVLPELDRFPASFPNGSPFAQAKIKSASDLNNYLKGWITRKQSQVFRSRNSLPSFFKELLRESKSIGEAYVAGYLSQASQRPGGGQMWSRNYSDFLEFHLKGLLGIGTREGRQRNRLHKVVKELKLESLSIFQRKPTHANAFLFYLAVVGLQSISEKGNAVIKANSVDLASKINERLHYLLAKASVDDFAEFDAGELAYAVASLRQLQADGQWWQKGAREEFYRRCFRSVFAKQSAAGLWDAGRPWIYTCEGGALHMISLERANAALEVLGDPLCVQAGLFQEFYDNFCRVHTWLRRTLQEFSGNNDSPTAWGWTSEHSFEFSSKIHLWVNAHALRFCILYRDALRRFLECLIVKRFPLVKSPTELKDQQLVDPCCEDSHTVWGGIDQALPQAKEFRREDWKYGFLLYGPPGTAKTSLAKQAAWKMKVPFITVTCSDFVGEGPDALEAQASRIFKLLTALPRGVVLFDEIDPFIHDREENTSRYEDFRFMTTSLLPKLQDLHDKKRIVFFIATNNIERIDSAIQRSGRIDVKICVPPPNSAARREIVKRHLEKAEGPESRKKEVVEILSENCAAWYTFSELKLLALSLMKRADPRGEMKDVFGQISPAASSGVYEQRYIVSCEHGHQDRVLDEWEQVARNLSIPNYMNAKDEWDEKAKTR
ncbi:MAG: ATP-binding protein [Verrucomicrobiia bacterium]